MYNKCVKTCLWLTLFTLFIIEKSSASPEKMDAVPWQFLFQLDNDMFAGTDRDYSSGVRFAFVKELKDDARFNKFLEKHLHALSGAGDKGFLPWRLRDRANLRFASGVGLTQLMFTPDEPDALSAPPGQRPYAGWLGLEFSLHAKSQDQVSGVTLTLGTTGKHSYAEESQEWVHTNISDSPIYQGWDSQVDGEWTVNLHFDHKQRIAFLERLHIGTLQFDGYYEWGGALGNFRTNMYAGSLVRAGINLPATYSTPRVQLGSYGHELFRAASAQDKSFSLLVFTGIRATAVAHDITLDGPVFSQFDTGVTSRPLFGEYIMGAGIRYRRLDISVSQTVRSDEFYEQSDHQRYGSIMARFYSEF